MTDVSTSISLIQTKLHRPTIYGVHIRRQRLLDQLNQRHKGPMTLISAAAGYGKTVAASSWLEASDIPSAWISLDDTDNDLRLFLSYLLAAIQTIFPGFGQQTLALMNSPTLAPVPVLAGSIANEIYRVKKSFILALDDFHLIKDKSVLDLIGHLLNHPPQSLHLVLICRRDPYLPISTLRARGLLTEIRTQDLRFSKTEIKELLGRMLGIDINPSTAAALSEKTEGWVTGVVLAAFSMRQQGHLDPVLLEPQVGAQAVMEYLFTEVFSRQPSEIKRYLMGTAILDRFCGPLCKAVRAPESDSPPFKFDEWEFIAWLKEQNLFLIPLDNENRWFRFHHLFQKLLHNQLKRYYSQDDINALHERASNWFAENGFIEEALKHALAGGQPETAGQLICKHGFDLLNKMDWPRLQRWLGMLPGDMVDRNLELLVLVSWLHVIFSRFTELRACLQKAEALCSTPAIAENVAGHIDALNAFQYNVAADGEHSLICARRALEALPKEHQWPRIHTLLLKASAHQMLGDIEKAHAAIETQLRHIRMYRGVSKSHFQANQCFIHWMQADLTGVLQAAEAALETAKDFREHQASYQALYFNGIAHYARNELQAAEDNLAPVIKEPYAQHALNFAHSAFTLALVHQALGRADEANRVSETVASFGVQTSHPGVVKLARAFQAELALGQGHFAEASYWAEQFVAKPFTLMYRVYIPQFTLVKVLMAQDTEASHDQAADILKQLFDFVTSSHNRRFQIDVLALQAILCDSQGEEPTALENLTRALQVAEPGGFIRPFVDLGPPMVDLLKRLHRKKIARGYIEKILAAFEQEGDQTILAEANGRPTAPARQPREPSPLTRPLVDPLTNRELDVLELLAQRLSNKEIADKLFISAETVKGHLQNIYQKLEVKKRREAVEKAKKVGIL